MDYMYIPVEADRQPGELLLGDKGSPEPPAVGWITRVGRAPTDILQKYRYITVQQLGYFKFMYWCLSILLN